MKHLIATLTVPLVLAAGPAMPGTGTSVTCADKFQKISEDWAERKSELTEAKDVTVSTEEGEVEVAAEDAEPTENWFGKPPDVETVDGYLEAAETAKEAGDEDACLEQLKNVEEAMAAQETAASDD